MAQEPVPWNLHAAHASAFDLNAPSASFSGAAPTGSGAGCTLSSCSFAALRSTE